MASIDKIDGRDDFESAVISTKVIGSRAVWAFEKQTSVQR
jgi:hypothetical protein